MTPPYEREADPIRKKPTSLRSPEEVGTRGNLVLRQYARTAEVNLAFASPVWF